MAWEKDLLERRQVANFIQNLLEGDDAIKVINIDSAWGSGKTFFLENWQEELKYKRGVVYFNAWERDYTGDPFISLVSSIKSQLEEQVGGKGSLESRFDEFSKKASSAFISASPIVFKAIGKGLVRKLIGVDVEEVAGSVKEGSEGDGLDKELTEEIADSAKGVADEAAVKAVQALIESSESSIQAVDEFRMVFEGLVQKVSEKLSGGENSEPVYIFIDELDRCRPPYAIELLERIKHFMDVPGCKFVIATDTKQLCHSVKAVYGSGFNSFGYLKRFFDITYTLDNSNLRNWVSSKVGFDFYGDLYCLDLSVKPIDYREYNICPSGAKPVSPDERTIISSDISLNEEQIIVLALCKTFSVSLRELDKILLHINASLLNIGKAQVHFFFLSYLVFLKHTDPDLYDAFINGGVEGVVQEIEGKYRAYKLYFISECTGVHTLAKEYARSSRTDRRDLMGQMDNSSGHHPYQSKILLDACNGENYLDYRKAVDLASHIS